ncbi:unnamed protein product [Linum tenue]|uniref:non-specific serine/threonine protein kinase n=1 Tax=Linum tenue TaxID=586396 RepID=A0AAV0JJ33_9ROSI|nr:unnamed protein product [Linum tenue]
MLEFKNAITNDPDGALTSWNSTVHFCRWAGISCSPEQRVIALSLPRSNLEGALSPHAGNLSFLQSLDLKGNRFRGHIPQEFGNLLRLQTLNLSANSLLGEIPVNLTRCSRLREIWLTDNALVGGIPEEVGLWPNIEVIRVSKNQLTGSIPASLGNLSKLQNFGAAYNHLSGRIPETVARLSRLSRFVVGINQLNGTIPPSLYNLSSMTILTLVYNQFQGTIPMDIGFTLPNLQSYGISLNWMSGPIPASLCNASQMQDMNMNRNSFSGSIPTCFGSLPNLLYYNSGLNNLGTNSSGDLEFITGLSNCSQLQELGVSLNNLGGELPDSVANLSAKLYQFDVSFNSIRGNIPGGLQNLASLNKLDLSYNLFTGQLPSYFSKFQSLQGMWMAENQLSGGIPSYIGNLSGLTQLDVSNNNLEGVVPRSLGSCQQLNLLDLSANGLTGQIPREIFNLSSLSIGFNLSRNSLAGHIPYEIGSLEIVEALDLSYNSMIGGIPDTIGECKSLKALFLQGNSFTGSIPPTLGSLQVMKSLDLSLNNLTGGIPPGLQDIQTMQYLNLSFNRLQGEVPTKGVFTNASGVSVIGNLMLCDGVAELHLPDCPIERTTNGKRVVKLTLIIVLVSVFVLSLAGLLLHCKMRRSKKKISDGSSALSHFVMVSYKDLHQGTNGFSPENLIGSGGFGTGIWHRNLVRILTYCSSLDRKGKEFKALVFEYMPNGSLEEWLHSSRNLTLIQRLNIAADVASGLYYLHDLCETPIVHCDVKPSNLDADMVAHVSDFGLARVLSTNVNNSSQTKSSTIGIKGTIGYAPPEYGMGIVVSKEGDVYSYGILLLEIFTGKRPTSEMFGEGVNIHDFVKAAIPNNILSVLDPLMILSVATCGLRAFGASVGGVEIEEMVLTESARNCLLAVLEIAVGCSTEFPSERMKMADVAKKLISIRDGFIASTSVSRQRRTERG